MITHLICYLLKGFLSCHRLKRLLLRFLHHLPTRHHFRHVISNHHISHHPTKSFCNLPTFNNKKNFSAAVPEPQRPSTSPHLKACTSPSHDQIDSHSPSPEKTRPLSPSTRKESSCSLDKENYTLPLVAQSNSSSVVYHKTGSLPDTICFVTEFSAL